MYAYVYMCVYMYTCIQIHSTACQVILNWDAGDPFLDVSGFGGAYVFDCDKPNEYTVSDSSGSHTVNFVKPNRRRKHKR